MRIVLDTNVLMAAFLRPHSTPAMILRLILQGEIELVTNAQILDEYEEVLLRPKFKLNKEKVRTVLDFILMKSLLAPALIHKVKLPDRDDEPFLEVALGSKADAIVTDNKKHYPPKACKGIKILTPHEFLSEL